MKFGFTSMDNDEILITRISLGNWTTMLETEEKEAPATIEDHFNWPKCNDDKHTCDDLLQLIEALGEDEEEGKLRLAILLLVESIVSMRYAKKKCKFEKEYVNIVKENMTISWEIYLRVPLFHTINLGKLQVVLLGKFLKFSSNIP